MLKKLFDLMAQLKTATTNPQLAILPATKGMAIMIAWEHGDKTYEVAQAFTRAECETATDGAINAALDVLAGAVWEQIAAQNGETLTPEEAAERVKYAASQAAAQKAVDKLIEVASR